MQNTLNSEEVRQCIAAIRGRLEALEGSIQAGEAPQARSDAAHVATLAERLCVALGTVTTN